MSPTTRAVFFDVDFTLIYPGPVFAGEGYGTFCARYGIAVDPALFEHAVTSAAPLLDSPEGSAYDAEIFVAYTRHIIEQMGGRGPALDSCAREIYAEWAVNHHFALYEEVPGVLRELAEAGLRVGLISNSHRCLTSFQEHFDLDHLVSGAVSSAHHGSMKPHPSIFQAAMRLMDVSPAESVMVGDSVQQDIEGALRSGMRAVLLHRGDAPHPRSPGLATLGVPTIPTLTSLKHVLSGS